MLQRYLVVWLSLLSLLAYCWPAWFGGGFDPFEATYRFQPWRLWNPEAPAQPGQMVAILIGVTMFFVGCLLTRAEIALVFARWPMVLAGTAIQYTAMPLLAFVGSKAFGLSPELQLGVIMVGCVPGAMASNVLTLAAGGNVSYSVSLTTSSTILSPIMVPLGLWLTLGATTSLEPVRVAQELLQQVVGPVVAGHLLCRFLPAVEQVMRRVAPVAANLTILWLIAVVVGINRERLGGMFTTEHRAEAASLMGALLTINVLGYLAGYWGATLLRMPEGMRRALTLEVGMQNAGVGTSLVLKLFSNPVAAIPTAMYTFGCMLSGALLAQFWARRGPAEDADVVATSSVGAGDRS